MIDIELEVNGQKIDLIQAMSALATLGIISGYSDIESVLMRQKSDLTEIEVEMNTNVSEPQFTVKMSNGDKEVIKPIG